MSQQLKLIELTKNYQEMKNEIKQRESIIINKFKEVFEEEIVQLMKKLPSVKVLTWTQTTKWEGGMSFDFKVNDPVFLSFKPKRIHLNGDDYADNCYLEVEEGFIIGHISKVEKSLLTIEEKEICQQIFTIFQTNEKPLQHLFGENIAGYVTSDNIKIYDYESY